MKPVSLKVARIGNSRGVRIPAATLARYEIGDEVLMEERSDGILLRPPGAATPKLSWDETARDMAAATEDWSAWDAASADGLDTVPWSEPRPRPRRVAEPTPTYEVDRPPSARARKKK
jgi:antitoxin component of MazEF toxin-antitoxin module